MTKARSLSDFIESDGSVTLVDNQKIKVGTGNDLEIYHDGTRSYVDDTGSGSLWLRGGDVAIKSTTSETMASFANNGAVTLYHDNAQKLETTSTGLDVTGTATMDGLDITENANARLYSSDGIGEVGDGNFAFQAVNSAGNALKPLGFRGEELRLATNKEALRIANNGDISFYEDTGTTAKFFWDASADSLGIGTTSPSSGMQIKGDGKSLKVSSADYDIGFLGALGSGGTSVDKGYFYLKNAGTTKIQLHSDGDSYFNGGSVGIGTTSVTNNTNRTTLGLQGAWGGQLDIMVGSTVHAQFGTDNFITGQSCRIQSQDGIVFRAGGANERLRITSSGNVKIKTTADYYANDLVLSCANNGGITVVGGTGDTQYLAFADGTSGNARYRGYIEYSHSSDQMAFATGGETKARINSANDWHFGENSSDFRLRGGNYGSIFDSNPNQNTNIRYHNTAGMYFNVGRSTGNYVFEQNGTGRFTISSSGGANGSDRKLKTNIEDIEYGLETVKLLQPRKFDWKDTPEEEKESIGFIAQEVQEIIPELVTSSEHPDGEENNTLFLNYAAMTSVLTKAIQEQQALIETLTTRIEALEG